MFDKQDGKHMVVVFKKLKTIENRQIDDMRVIMIVYDNADNDSGEELLVIEVL
ncbi:hypothetical protein [Pelagibaculum spongiae]|uniref:hypothetical protein n=1 Tax=Pelagibaculum spongiae TaxID=2080658 RepID=UPI0013149FB4|nr:hypothetical protein [Pelagibaculum spongiae]